jgi:hypothetical protein
MNQVNFLRNQRQLLRNVNAWMLTLPKSADSWVTSAGWHVLAEGPEGPTPPFWKVVDGSSRVPKLLR